MKIHLPLSSPRDSNRPVPLNIGLSLTHLNCKRFVWTGSAELATASCLPPPHCKWVQQRENWQGEEDSAPAPLAQTPFCALNCTPSTALHMIGTLPALMHKGLPSFFKRIMLQPILLLKKAASLRHGDIFSSINIGLYSWRGGLLFCVIVL